VKIADYYRQILVPANVAVSAIRRAGVPVDMLRVRTLREVWLKEVRELEAFVEGEAAKVGVALRYSEKHAVPPVDLAAFLYGHRGGPKGLGLTCYGETETGLPSTADDDLMPYASLKVPRDDDHPAVRAVLQIRSLAGAVGRYLDSFERTVRADGCCHPKFNWALRTARLSAQDPPMHQIPERADRRVADAVKACIVPRIAPAPNPMDWDPRKHGSCIRWDIAGAEAAIRAAMLTHRFCSRPDPVAWEYIRLGKDIHSKTASLIFNVQEGTYKKGTYERDTVGKNTFFAKIFGATWWTVQDTAWKKARVWLPDAEAMKINDNFDSGYTGLVELYGLDKRRLGELGYCEDAYGRRRHIEIPSGAEFKNGEWIVRDKQVQKALDHCFHIAANTPTQSTNATDNLWMIALCYHGEYVELRVPPMWESGGIPFPEAAGWRMHGGPGPGGEPLLAWHMNTVHDSGWGDCAPGHHLEAASKLIWRRCRAVPLDWRLEADVPYRIDLQVGPDMAHLRDYNKVAQEFGLEPMPER